MEGESEDRGSQMRWCAGSGGWKREWTMRTMWMEWGRKWVDSRGNLGDAHQNRSWLDVRLRFCLFGSEIRSWNMHYVYQSKYNTKQPWKLCCEDIRAFPTKYRFCLGYFHIGEFDMKM